MKHFDMTANMDLRIAVPDEFVRCMREAATAEDASEFLRVAQVTYPEDDDEFILMILRNGLKRHIRDSVMQLLQESGLGGTFAPVTLKDRTPLIGHHAVLTTEVEDVIPA